MQEWSLQFEWKKDTIEVEQIEYELTNNVRKLKLNEFAWDSCIRHELDVLS